MTTDNGSGQSAARLSRRAVLRTAAATGFSALMSGPAPGQPSGEGTQERAAVLGYLRGLARPGGGYAWDELAEPHLTPTYAAVGCYRLLGQDPPDKGAVAEFLRTHHPSWLKKLEQEHRVFTFQQVQGLRWLGAEASEFRPVVQGWARPLEYMKRYEQHGYPVFRSEMAAFTCRELLGVPRDDLAPHFVAYLDARRRPNGSFNNTPAADGSDGHVLNTWWGLEALRVLGRTNEKRSETVAWLQVCQLADGGFTYRPGADAGGWADVAYTWAAVRALALLGAAPVRRDDCLRWLGSLGNADGGCGDRPGWASSPVATYYALDALAALGTPAAAPPSRRPPRPAEALPPGLKVFSAQIEAHGQGSPAEAVDLARALRIHLWGAKNARPGWLARAQALAERQGVPVTFFAANEEYGTWVHVPGLGTYSHTSDVMAPAGAEAGASLANQGVVSWADYRRRRLTPLEKAGGRLVWQFGENEELTRIFLDDSLQRGGYAAVSTFHFGNPDFTNTEPFLLRYRQQLPFVALQDAHGEEPWWFADMTEGFRTLFLAREPTWDGWLEALRRNWVVAVRHDAVSGQKTWLHGGPPAVVELVRRSEPSWRWWDSPAVRRPPVSVVAVRPDDQWEAGRPERGVAVRVRCAWENTAQGLPKRPLAELKKLVVDGAEVRPTRVETKKPGGPGLKDRYHLYHLPAPAPGRHVARAVVRVLASGAEVSRDLDFDA